MSSPIDVYVEKFVSGANSCHTVDCVLIRLSSAFFAIRDFAESFPLGDSREKDFIYEFLNNPNVMKILAGLIDNIDIVESKIQRDVRFKNLRPYLSQILEAIRRSSERYPSSRSFTARERPPLWRIEYRERIVRDTQVDVSRPTVYETTAVKKRSMSSKTIAVAVVLAVTVLVVLLFIHYLITPINIPIEFSIPGSQGTRYMGLGSLKLLLTSDHLIVEYSGRWLPYLWIDIGDRVVHLSPYRVSGADSVVADYVYVNSTYSTATYPLKDILFFIKGYYRSGDKLEIDLPLVSKICHLELTNNSSLLFTTCEDVRFTGSSSPFKSVFDVLLDDVNRTTINYLYDHLFNGSAPGDLAASTWFILTWLDRNAEYNYTKALSIKSSIFEGVVDPITFLNKKNGVCVDYAVFTSTALLAGGAKEAYILMFDAPEGPHATTGVIINNTLFILDQKLPVYEWADYEEYIFKPIGSEMQVVRIALDENGRSSIEARIVDPEYFSKTHPDTYPSDILPEELVNESILELADRLGIEYSRNCSHDYYYKSDILGWEPLKAYHPLFYEYFKEFFINILTDMFGDDLLHARCFWASVEGRTLYIYIGSIGSRR